MSRSHILSLSAILLASLTTGPRAAAATPNIVYILADDMGYGDVHALNPEGKLATPNLDELAAQGMVFRDAHSGSSVCTPTRYGILTGRYSWRSRLKRGVLYGYDRRLIEPGRLTVATLLQKNGYDTACVGKWHLGMDWPLQGGGVANGAGDADQIDYSGTISNGPNSVGFDYFFGISASLDMPPYVYIENDRCTELPTAQVEGGLFGRAGAAVAGLEPEHVLPELTQKSVEYIKARASEQRPFFLYFPLPAPHTPIAPTEQWQGRSGVNGYGDFVMQVDDTVGQIMAALDEAELTEDTLVIFTADNGCSPAANIKQMQAMGHRPSYHFRGHKADIYDGGHRVPLIARWPQHIAAGSTSDPLICLTDLTATCAEIVGAALPDDAGEDSVSMLPALLGEDDEPLREAVVHHSINGSFAIRKGDWKLALCPGSGGWSAPRPGSEGLGEMPPVQLYHLRDDVGETENVEAQQTDVVKRLTGLLRSYVDRGRSTPGAVQQNQGEVDIFRSGNAK